MAQIGYAKAITIELFNPTARPFSSGGLVWSGVITVDGEALARVIHEGGTKHYELLNVQNAVEKWSELERHAQARLPDAFVPLDQFVGMLWAEAMAKHLI